MWTGDYFADSCIDRIAGSSKEITALRDAFNRGENPIQSFTDVNAVCDLVKQWLVSLPVLEILLIKTCQVPFVAISNLSLGYLSCRYRCIQYVLVRLERFNSLTCPNLTEIEQYDERSAVLRKLIRELPTSNYDVLKRIMEHLDK